MLLMPTAAAASKPSYTFVEDSNFYGFTAGTQTYKIHKTSDLAIVGSGESADTTAPAEATSLPVFGAPSSIRATWTDPADADLDKINVWYRTT